MLHNTLATALIYVGSGLSVIPIRRDGSKAPSLPSWSEYQSRHATESELKAWFNNDKGYGLAVIGGAVSGSLEIFDCDAPELFEAWCELVESVCPGLLTRLVIVQTPSVGYHVYYRCSKLEGNQKLAQQIIKAPEGAESCRIDGRLLIIKTLFETRGEGGYVLAPGSPRECHPTGKPYTLLSGNLNNVPIITPQERAVILDAARSFNDYVRPERVYHQGSTQRQPAYSNRPGDDFNAKADWYSLLSSHGWKHLFQQGEVSYWRRPGKPAPGISATTNYGGSNLLYVFSTNAEPFSDNAAYSLFSALTLLEHGGDFHAAAKALVKQGYGRQRNKKLATPQIGSVRKPEQTAAISKPQRPAITIHLSSPTRPALTAILRCPNEI